MARIETENTEEPKRNYDAEFDAFMKEASEEIKKLVAHINNEIISKFSEEEIERIQDIKDKIDEFNEELFEDDDNGTSIKSNIKSYNDIVKSFYNEITQYRKQLFGSPEKLGEKIQPQFIKQYKEDEYVNKNGVYYKIEEEASTGIRGEIEEYKETILKSIKSYQTKFMSK